MPLYDRNKPKSLGKHKAESVEGRGSLLRSDPLSRYFEPEGGEKPKDIVYYFIAKHIKKYGRIIELYQDQRILRRHINSLLGKHSPLLIKRAISLGVQWCPDPFSIKYLKKVIKRIEEEWPDLVLDK